MPTSDQISRFVAVLMPFAQLALAIGAALLLHRIAVRLVRRLKLPSDGFLLHALQRSLGFSRLAFVTAALTIALPAVALPFSVESDLQHLALILLIVLVGWNAIVLTQLFGDLAVRRHPIDVEDNLIARRSLTQIRILSRTMQILVVIVTVSAVLVTFDSVKEYGVSLLASAGAAGLVLGFAAKPVLANLIAGVQIALTQPIRIDDVVIVEGEWAWIEEIGSSFVTVRLWDWRRMVVPLTWFIEQPLQNWTRESASVIGTVNWHVDHGVPVEKVRTRLEEMVAASPRWDRRVVNLQVTEATDHGIVLRGLMSARNAPLA